ncbi:MAG: hypothetical protein IT303_10545 [Dehalococcoidia bacterium]|nr:hypothetical protein [Dehalococcoidia bacterium]
MTHHDDESAKDLKTPAGTGIREPEGTITNRTARRQEQLDRLEGRDEVGPTPPDQALFDNRNKQAYEEDMQRDAGEV